MAPSASRSALSDSKSRGNHLFAELDSDDEGGNNTSTFTSAFTPAFTPVTTPRRSQRRTLRAVSIETPGDFDRNEYESANVDWAVRKVLREVPGKNEEFQVLFEDGKTRTVSISTFTAAFTVSLTRITPATCAYFRITTIGHCYTNSMTTQNLTSTCSLKMTPSVHPNQTRL